MFCMHCGKELPENAKFCPYCGNALTEEPPTNEEYLIEEIGQKEMESAVLQTGQEEEETASERQPEGGEAASDAANLDELVGKNQAYYLEEFRKIDREEKTRFNWASFWLSILHAAYRGVWKQWLSFMAIPLIIYVVAWVVGILAVTGMLGTGFWIGILTSGIGGAVYGILFLAWDIRFAMRFNRVYYEHIKKQTGDGKAKKGPSWGRVFAALAILLAISVSFAVAENRTALLLFQNMADSYDDSAYVEYEYGDDSYNAYSDYNASEYDDSGDSGNTNDYTDYTYDDYADDAAYYLNGNHDWQSAGWPYSVTGEWVSGYESDDLYVAFYGDGTGMMHQGDYDSVIAWCYEESGLDDCSLSFVDEASWVYYLFIADNGDLYLYDRVGNECIMERIGQ